MPQLGRGTTDRSRKGMTDKSNVDRKALAIALASTVIGLCVLRAYMSRFELEVAGGPAHTVLVMASDAKAGSVLTREQITTRRLPEAYLDARSIPVSKLDELVGLRLALAMNAQDTLLETDLE